MITNSTTGLKDIGNSIKNAVSDYLADSDFISRTVGMTNSYEGIMLLVQLLGREPVSLLGKDYSFIYDHVRRNYLQGTEIPSNGGYNCPKFTFYKDKPTIRFANPYEDSRNMVGRIEINGNLFQPNLADYVTETSYAESDDDTVNNKGVPSKIVNEGVAHGGIACFPGYLNTCDIIKKTNDNFRNGKYKTLIARFHTNSEDSKSPIDTTQTAISKIHGMSHGRNLLKLESDAPNGYDNPYCRVWTYHHQYHTLQDTIRPFGTAKTADALERVEMGQHYGKGGFRTVSGSSFGGGSTRLDTHGVLNYRNNMVRIAPTAKIKDYFEHKENDDERQAFSTKRCMFSIENLAWKDTRIKNDEYDPNGLSPEQRGPLGGRIMWFPPYDLQFNEDVSVDWNSNKFIGRGENVYTYTNTERRGNLSFTLLIDHPSVLDYWTRLDHEGKELSEKNKGGVDGKNNEEQTLLRFFAGCDILTAKPQEYRQRKGNVVAKKDEKKDKLPDVEVAKVEKGKIYCILYYPNNYSGVDDKPFGGNVQVNAVHYLMNGIGAQKFVNPTTKNAEDIPTTISVAPSRDGIGHGGYEINGNISIATEALVMDAEKRKSTYADRVNVEKKAQYLTDENGGVGYNVKYGENDYTLAKIIGSEALPYSDVLKKLWHRHRWYYRVDKDYENHKLSNQKSYIDTRSEELNGSGYEKVRGSGIEVPNEDSENHLISFADLFCAIEGSDNKVISEINEKDVVLVKRIINKEDGYRVKNITFRGHASKAGYGISNETLADNRVKTFKKWMMEKFPKPEGGEIKIAKPITEGGKRNDVNNGDANSLNAKIWRSASVIIEYEKSNVSDAAKAPSDVKTTIENKETSKNNILTARDWLYNTPEGNALLSSNEELKEKAESGNLTMDDISKITGKDYFDVLSWNYDNSFRNIKNGFTIKKGNVQRYDNEGEFFEALKNDAPFLHNLISEKIKYFDPAFHSISPEGFNARLTFLHQCTRQGSTVENNSASNISTAYNLAFGRPPVCVLRIGDFYYTKIIIDSLSIQYETPQWDLNPEGIGVMPMFAKINIGFKFLGGSDLGGPIARLQNAVSFNYYANTSVYDDRAEMVQYNENGNGQEVKFKGWSYPNNANFGERFGTKKSK